MTRKGSTGGRHVAMERGLRPGWCGWPFRRELRELAAKCFVGQRRTSPPVIPTASGVKPCQT
jgi:hypothetical protein